MYAISISLKAAVVAGLLSASFVSNAFAQPENNLSVSASGMTVTAQFTRPTPCTGYELAWGDGEEEVVEAADVLCIQVLDEKTLRHEYEEEGEYTVTLTLSGETYSEEVAVPAEAVAFDVDDVKTITATWIDPSEMMADEEYYVYTITLESDEVITVEAGGFTTTEYRDQQFAQAGYTGDVEALLDMVEYDSEDETDTPEETPEVDTPAKPEREAIYQQLRTTLLALIARLQALLQ